ncbi:MAG: hypothetical protein J7K33_10300 [Candidatus Marinimicrobia bacterium]|nr:hypothetical protein [Candidatus Neomarinimicrobiota bacterium]
MIIFAKYILIFYTLKILFIVIHEAESLAELFVVKLLLTPLFLVSFYIIYRSKGKNLIIFMIQYFSVSIIRMAIVVCFIVLIFYNSNLNFNAILAGVISIYTYLLSLEVVYVFKEKEVTGIGKSWKRHS